MEAAAASPAASPGGPERAIPHAPPNPASSSSHRRFRQVDRGLEGRAGLEQHRAQAVLVPGRAGDDVVALRREGAGGLEEFAAAQAPDREPGTPRADPRDHRGVALVGLGLAGE